MIIILEGPDGAGKTTLANELAETFQLPVYHEGPPPAGEDPFKYYGAKLLAVRHTGAVLDRFALGERVYAPIFRSGDPFADVGWRAYKRIETAANVMTVLCMPNYETAHGNWLSRKKSEMFQDRYENIYNGFAALGAECDALYDYTKPEHHRGLFSMLGEWSTRPMLSPQMSGSPYAKYLLVGDRGSASVGATCNVPFHGMTASSGYLNQALFKSSFQEDEIALVNAWQHDDGRLKRTILPRMFERVIALGNEAADACAKQGIDYKMVPHPQFYNRFHHDEIDKYVELLESCR